MLQVTDKLYWINLESVTNQNHNYSVDSHLLHKVHVDVNPTTILLYHDGNSIFRIC